MSVCYSPPFLLLVLYISCLHQKVVDLYRFFFLLAHRLHKSYHSVQDYSMETSCHLHLNKREILIFHLQNQPTCSLYTESEKGNLKRLVWIHLSSKFEI